jgi:hypothetical protein
MPLTLSITDDQTGDGATATIVGSDPQADNAVHVQPVSGNLASGAWQLAAERVGDGTAALALARGFYWAHCRSMLDQAAACSNLVYFQVTQLGDAVAYRCLLAVQARIRGLALTGLAEQSVLVQKVATDRDLGQGRTFSLPVITVSPYAEELIPSVVGTNLRDDVVYRLQVTILAANNQDQQSNLALYLHWRERIAQAFRQQPLPGVAEVYQCEVLPHDIISAEAFLNHNLFCSSLLVHCWSREPRGFAL